MATSGMTSFSLMEKDCGKITINGVTYTTIEYKKMLAEKKKADRKASGKKVKVVKAQKEIGIVAEMVSELVKSMTTLKSIQAYREHAYRQWGTIAEEILAHGKIRKPMAQYCLQFCELKELVAEIEKLAKRNEKAAYQYVEKVIWKLDDMKASINAITKGVNDSGVCERFKGHEAIYGNGRRLGLSTVVKKCGKTLTLMESAVKELEKIVENGTDPFLYGTHMSIRTKSRCWA